MSDHESLMGGIEEKIRLIGEQLQSERTENSGLKEEIRVLKNKITDLEKIVNTPKGDSGNQNSDQIDTIKKELNKYISEVESCIELVKEM